MSLDRNSLGSFGQLATAIGLLDGDDANPHWFDNPVGSKATDQPSSTTNQHGLRHLLEDDDQRHALIAFVDEVLGPPDAQTRGGKKWVPLFTQTDPDITVSAVIDEPGTVHLGVGFEYDTGDSIQSARIATRVHVPLFQFARRGGSALPSDAAVPGWLLLGRPEGKVELSVDVSFTGARPVPGQPQLGGVALSLAIPTALPAGTDPVDLGIGLTLRDLQLPGAQHPRTFSLDAHNVNELGKDVFEMLIALVREQAGALDATQYAPFAALAGLLGLRDVLGLPSLPLADLPTQGISALVGWAETVLADDSQNGARRAWLGELAKLVGAQAQVDGAASSIGWPISLPSTSAGFAPTLVARLGLRVEQGTGGHPVLVPFTSVELTPRDGATARFAADLLRADTGTGQVTALPDIRVEAVFGADDGGTPLVSVAAANTNVTITSVHMGLGLDAQRNLAFRLTAHRPTAEGGPLDLSSPSAALDAVGTVLGGALAGTIATALGRAGDVVNQLLGLTPPSGVNAMQVSDLLANPLAELSRYWRDLTGTPATGARVLGGLAALLADDSALVPPPAPGAGTAEAPWRITLVTAGGASLEVWVWREGDLLLVELVGAARRAALTDHEVRLTLGLTLLRANLAAAQLGATFATRARGRVGLVRADGESTWLDLGSLAVQAREIGAEVSWVAQHGLRVGLVGDGLAVGAPELGVTLAPLVLPTWDEHGALSISGTNWAAIERVLAALLARVQSPVLTALLDFVGWRGAGAHLPLAGLFGADPAGTVTDWLAGLTLDRDRVRQALQPIAALLRGRAGRGLIDTLLHGTTDLYGIGTRDVPFRCPVGSEPDAPSLAVWLDPDGPPSLAPHLLSRLTDYAPPTPATIAALLGEAANVLPDVNDLLVMRTTVASGLAQLGDSWLGTDGRVGRPPALPPGVTGTVLAGRAYGELVALGRAGLLLDELAMTAPDAIVHIGCESIWAVANVVGTAFDLSATSATAAPEQAPTLPATDTGTWYVRLPTVEDAATVRPDRGGVGEQTARLAALLATRTAPLMLVGYGASGAAVVRAAAGLSAGIASVVTVGTPWSADPPPVMAAVAMHARALLRRLGPVRPSDPDDDTEADPRRRIELLLARDDAALPPAQPAGTLAVRAVFGGLSGTDIAAGVGEFVASALWTRARAVPPGAGVTDGGPAAVNVAIDAPMARLELAGVHVAVDTTIRLCRLTGSAGKVLVSTQRSYIVDVRVGVPDGWLVDEPNLALRWLSARVEVGGTGPGDAEVVLHEAHALGVDAERWVLRAGDGTDVTTEARMVLGAAVARLRDADPNLRELLRLLGLTRALDPAANGQALEGLDPDGLDRLLHDPAATMRAAVGAPPPNPQATPPVQRIAAAVRGLISVGGGAPDPAATGTTVRWGLPAAGPAQVYLGVDLATGALDATLSVAAPDRPSVEVRVASADATSVTASLVVGAVDEHAGGLRLVASTSPKPNIAVEWGKPGGDIRTVGLLPTPDTEGLRALATVAMPAVAAHAAATALRGMASDAGAAAIDVALDSLGLLRPPDATGASLAGTASGTRAVIVPIGLFADPGEWLRGAVAAWREHPAISAVALLEALAPLLTSDPNRVPGSWPIADSVRVHYASLDSRRLRLRLEAAVNTTVDGVAVAAAVSGGLVVSPDAPPQPEVGITVTVDGWGPELVVAPTASPPVTLNLRRPGAPGPLRIFPDGPGLGQVVSSTAQSLVPVALNALAARGSTSPSSVVEYLGNAIRSLGTALDLIDGTQFTAAKINTFAADPAAKLLEHVGPVVGTVVGAVAAALDPGHTLVSAGPVVNGSVAVGLGRESAGQRPVTLVLGADGGYPTLAISADFTFARFIGVQLQQLKVSAAGVDVAVQIGPIELDAGPFTLRPVLALRAGSAVGSDRMVGVGLALDDIRSVQVWWTPGATPTLNAVPPTPGVDNATQAAQWLLGLGLSFASGLVMGRLRPVLGTKTISCLSGVVLTPDGTSLDPHLAVELFDPHVVDLLMVRLKRLLWNAAHAHLSVTFGDPSQPQVRLGLVAPTTNGRTQVGLNVTLVDKPYRLADGQTRVDLEVDATWVTGDVDPGLSVYVLAGTTDADLDVAPGVAVAGVGLRFTKASGPLLSFGGVSIDGIAVHVYAEVAKGSNDYGYGGGVNLELAGFALAPSGGGSNAIANGIMQDAGKSSASSRPAFSPAIAIQKHPDTALGFSVRAGRPPGPWWLVIQRQLGPLYLDQIGLDTKEDATHTVTRIALLFDGSVSLFGFSAGVKELGIAWNRPAPGTPGNALDIHNWSVDLKGLAIAANFSGASVVGGLLKTENPVGYIGMLMGRFGTYGLSIFGGYSDAPGVGVSFFVFGAINGPIGGPPYFFITGAGGGLGINRGLNVPEDPAKVARFPFVAGLDPAAPKITDPMGYLVQLGEYFPVKKGNFWFAAGISFTICSLVDGVAALAVSFGSDGLDLYMLGLARVALPRPGAEFVTIEMGLLVRFSTREGVFMMRAGLTDNSWLLYREVRLTGGFAIVFWWKGRLAGQFVLTMGGYHPDFYRAGYPEVPRLGLMWRVSDYIVIKGGTYFALTSEALMTGVEAEASLDFAFVWARVSFGLHAILYFDPFHFEAIVFARIAAGVQVEVGPFRVSQSFNLNAEVKIWGPDFAGEAKLEVGPTTVACSFGSLQDNATTALSWSQFVAKYSEAAGQNTARALSAITGSGSQPPATGGADAVPTADGSADRPYEVFAEFEMTVVSTIPFDSVSAAATVPVTVMRSDGRRAGLGLKPMLRGGLRSTLNLSVTNAQTLADATAFTNKLAVGDATRRSSTVELDAYPVGVWGEPEPSGVDSPPVPGGDVLHAGARVRLVAEALKVGPGPQISYRQVASARSDLPLWTVGSLVGIAVTALAVTDDAEAVLAAARPSALGRASLHGERVAPPMMGTLSAGLVPVASTNATATAVVLVPALAQVAGSASTVATRGPRVVGFLPAGEGAAARVVATTVADAALPRVAPPTRQLVRARLSGGPDDAAPQASLALPIDLISAPPPTVTVRQTVMVARLPRTGAAGADRSASRSAVGRTPAEQARYLGAGDTLVLALPDSAVDTGTDRPTLAIDGPARVVLVRGADHVVYDGPATSSLAIPARTSVAWVQAGTPDAGDGVAGWHSASRIAAIGTSLGVAAGCVLSTRDRTGRARVGWTNAGQLLAGAQVVTTRFAGTVGAVAVVLLGSPAQPGSDQVTAPADAFATSSIEFSSEAILAGTLAGDNQTVLVYRVAPVDLDTSVTVTVHTGGSRWRVGGVLGSPRDATWLANRITGTGVVESTARLRAATGVGCRVSWVPPASRGDDPGATRMLAAEPPTVPMAVVEPPTVPMAVVEPPTVPMVAVEPPTVPMVAAEPPTVPMVAVETAAEGRRRWWRFGRR